MSKKVSDLRAGEKKDAYLGGSIPNPLQSRPIVTPHTYPNVPSTTGSISGKLLLEGRVPHDALAAVITGTFHWPLQFWEQLQLARSHVCSVGNLAKNWNAVFGQETLDQV
jgi:hypothetical protein